MGKKVNPKIIRIGITRTWQSKWFDVGKKYISNLKQDIYIRRYLLKKFREAGVDKVEVERNAKKISIGIHTAKPGFIIGRGGAGLDDLKKDLHKRFLSRPAGIRPGDVKLNIFEVDRPNLSSQIVMQSMILDIEKRMPYRRVMKQVINRVERSGALGIKIKVGGRLNGAEIARSETLTSGKVPLHTLRADIDYARGAANTIYGAIGVKVWIYKGDKFEKEEERKGEVVGKKMK